MAFEDILEPFERMLGDVFTPTAIRNFEAKGDWSQAWYILQNSGFLDALVPEDAGGFGLGWDAATALFQALGRHAVPFPLGETMIGRGWLAQSGSEIPQEPIVFGGMPGSLQSMLVFGSGGTELAVESEDCSAQLALLYAAQIAGAADHLLAMSVGYVNERVQFGKPIGRQQALQQQLAVMAQETVAVRLAVDLVCADGRAPTYQRSAAAKALASRYAISIAGCAHGVHGAIGISAEYDLQLYTRRMHALRLAGGAETYWETRLGKDVLSHDALPLSYVRQKLHH